MVVVREKATILQLYASRKLREVNNVTRKYLGWKRTGSRYNKWCDATHFEVFFLFDVASRKISCVLFKDTRGSYCVYKMNYAVLASFLFCYSEGNNQKTWVAQTVLCRRHQYTLLILYTNYILLFIYCNVLVTIGLNYIMQNQLGLNSRGRAGASCEGVIN